jgi:ornithine cyclodeaminase
VTEKSRVTLYSRNRATALRMAAETAGVGRVPGAVAVETSVRRAVRAADVVCTATSTDSPRPLVGVEDLCPGVHVNAVGGRTAEACEIAPSVLGRALVVVEDREAACREAGEVRAVLRRTGAGGERLVSLAELVGGARPGRTNDRQITLFKSVGLALEDVAAAAAALEPPSAGRPS